MEQVLDWLNENESRAFPLLPGANNKDYILTEGKAWTLPDDLLLDLQLIYTDGKLVSPVLLKQLSCTAENTVKLIFGTATQEIDFFEIEKSAIVSLVFPLYIRNTSGSLCVLGKGLKSFADTCEDSVVTLDLNIPIEPALCVEFYGPWLGVSSLSVSPEKQHVDGNYVSALPLTNTTTPTILTGDIRLLEGYNFNVIIGNNLINLAVDRSYGLPIGCSTSFLEEKYLDCDQIISYINGIPPNEDGEFTISSGDNISIISGQNIENFSDAFLEQSNAHTLFVGLNFDASNICKPVNITPSLL